VLSTAETVYEIIMSPGFIGFKEDVNESPNGDGKIDFGKQYSHLSREVVQDLLSLDYEFAPLFANFLNDLHEQALWVAKDLNIPEQYLPDANASVLRALRYPPGTTSHKHTDFDMFTINVYRNMTNPGLPTGMKVHYGEVLEMIDPSYEATEHYVCPCPLEQRSMVYFVSPPLDVVLPNGEVMKDWLFERKNRSRY